MLIYKREGVDPTKTHWRIDQSGEAVRYDKEGNDWEISYLFHSGNPFKRDVEYVQIEEGDTKSSPPPKKAVSSKK